MTDSLLSRFKLQLTALQGAHEHKQVLQLLGEAEAYRLSDPIAREIAETIRCRPNDLERNCDLLNLNRRVTWIEFADSPRRPADAVPLPGAAHPKNVGLLLCVDDEDPDRLVMLTAWDFDDGGVRYSYATGSIDTAQLAYLAFGARKMLSRDPLESTERLLDCVLLNSPPGLVDEIKYEETVRHDDEEAADRAIEARLRGAKSDIISEVPFALGALLLLGTKDVSTTMAPGADHWTVEPGLSRSMFPWWRGFQRVGRKRSPTLRWSPTLRSASA